jgi:hypothetical protein
MLDGLIIPMAIKGLEVVLVDAITALPLPKSAVRRTEAIFSKLHHKPCPIAIGCFIINEEA